MIDITRDEYFDIDYNERKKKKYKFGRAQIYKKVFKICIALFILCTCINIALIYNFFNILSKM